MVDLTGVWTADDGAVYRLRQLSDNSVWWVGLSDWTQFHPGSRFTNVFRGSVDDAGTKIEGDWADVPRGTILQHGHLSMDIVTTDARTRVPAAQPPNGPLPPSPHPTHTIELRKRLDDTTGGFGASVWRRAITFPLGRDRFVFRLRHVQVPGGSTLSGGLFGGKLTPYRDFAVVAGQVGTAGIDPGWRSANRAYCAFVRGQDPSDGDITFDLVLDLPAQDALLHQPGFTDQSSRWVGPVATIVDKIQTIGIFHSEIVMYGRANDEDHCDRPPDILLPGWNETGGNSVLVNNLPISGNKLLIDGVVTFTLFPPGGPDEQAIVQLAPGRAVRVTGAICTDNQHDDRLEIHPVYAIDVPQDFAHRPPGTDLTGVWHGNDVGTYFVHQTDSEIWWLGLSEDQGFSFANTFRGAIDASTIKGEWADVHGALAQSAGTLELITGGGGALSTTLRATDRTGGFGGTVWTKMYDREWWKAIDFHPA